MKARTKLVLLVLLAASASGMSREAAAQDPLVLGVPLEPPNLDPTSGAAAAVDSVVYGNIFEGLVRITQSGDVAPALAESWDVSADGLVYTFRLRRGVRFHDGTSFDANDVKFSFDRALAPDSTNAQKALLSAISDVDVFDTHTVRLTLSRPSSSLLYFLGWGDAVIVAEESAAGNANNPVGTGPFRFSDWRRGVSIRLERNRDYWGVPARPGSVVFRIIGDPAAAYAAMKAGDLDAYPNYPAPENVAEFERDPNVKVVIGATAGKVIMAMNNGRPPFDDPLVRFGSRNKRGVVRLGVRQQDKEQVVRSTFTGRVSSTFLAFLLLLVDKHRIDQLDAILDRFIGLVKEHRGIIATKVLTAFPLTGEERNRIAHEVSRRTGKQVEVTVVEDPSLIGGIVVIVGNQIVDYSMRHFLRKLRDELLAVKV